MLFYFLFLTNFQFTYIFRDNWIKFFELNLNTKRNIKSRVDDDLIERIDSLNNESFESDGGYIFNNQEDIEEKDNDNLKIELNQTQNNQDNNEKSYE